MIGRKILLPFGITLSDKLRDHILFGLWFFVIYRPFPGDAMVLYPLAVFLTWSFIRDFNLILPIILRSLIIFAFPLWWALSALWGIETQYILRTSAQMFLTVIVCYAAVVRLSERDLVLSILFAGLWAGILSFMVFVTGDGLAQRGAFLSKNAMGLAMVLLWAAALCTMFDSQRPIWMRLLATAAAALAGFQIMIAHSVTAVLLATGVTVTVLMVGVLPRTGILRNPLILGFILICAAVLAFAAAWFFSFNTVNPYVMVLEAFGKDTTLTGRTELWLYAEEQIKEAPFLGVGAGGFWTPWDGSTTSRRIYDEFHKAYYATFTFHNSYYEIAVHQGLIGLGVAVATLIWLLWMIASAMFLRNSVPTAFFVTIALINLASSLTEASLFAAFNVYSMLFILGALLSVKNSPKLARHVHSYSHGGDVPEVGVAIATERAIRT